MDRLGSGILSDPTTGTGSAGAGGVRAWRRRQGAVKMGGEIIFLHLGGRRGGDGRWEQGGGGRKSRGRTARGAPAVAQSPPLPAGRGGWGEGRQDGGGEVGRAGRRCCRCRRHRRLRSGRLWLFKLSPPGRSCTGVASRGESKSFPQSSSAFRLVLPDSLPLPPSSGGRVGPAWGGRHLTPAWGLPRRPPELRDPGPSGARSRRRPRRSRFLRPSAPGPAVAARGALGPWGPRCPGPKAPRLGRGSTAGGRRLRSGRPLCFPRSTPGLRGPGPAGK